MSAIVQIAGNHGYAVLPIRAGRRAGRYYVAFEFFGQWRVVGNEDDSELLTWKTEEEALGFAEAWRLSRETSETYPLHR